MINKKRFYIFLMMISFIGVSIGYALINTTLNITGKSNVRKNTWDVYFDNIVVRDGSIEAVKIPTVTDKTTVDFEVALNLPGDYYEFTVDVINDGTIDAMIESFNKNPNLSLEQEMYLSYIVKYENDEKIRSKHLVKSNEFVRLKIRIEYKKDISTSDLPKTSEILSLGFNINFIQNDGNGFIVKDNGIKKLITIDGSLDDIGTIVTIGTEKFYTIGIEGDNVKLLSMYNLYVGNEVTSFNSETEEYTLFGIENPTGIQNEIAVGGKYDDDNLAIDFPWYGTERFSEGAYWEKDGILTGNVYNENSVLYSYIENYKNYLEKYIVISNARVILIEELTELGCDSKSCTSAPSWVYATTYWTSSLYDRSRLYHVRNNGSLLKKMFIGSSVAGIRPVIEIYKGDLERYR